MGMFAYRAVAADGRISRGTMPAISARELEARLRNAGMVTNDLGMTHWHMAHNNKGKVRLTALGQYFWRIAAQGAYGTPRRY